MLDIVVGVNGDSKIDDDEDVRQSRDWVGLSRRFSGERVLSFEWGDTYNGSEKSIIVN